MMLTYMFLKFKPWKISGGTLKITFQSGDQTTEWAKFILVLMLKKNGYFRNFRFVDEKLLKSHLICSLQVIYKLF